MASEAEIVVEVERVRCGHNSRLGVARIASGEPYVLAHYALVKPGLDNLVTELARNGHPFRVTIVDRHVSMIEWYGSEAG